MNRVNPLYLLVAVIVVILFLLFKTVTLHEELRESKSDYLTKKELAVSVDSLKNLSASKASLVRYLRNAKGFTSTKTETGIRFHAKALNKKDLNRIMAKILNSAYWIKNMKITKIDSQKASLNMEIVW